MPKTKAVLSFPVESLPIAAALLAAGLKIHSVDRSNPRRAVFTFNDNRAPELVSRFVCGTLALDAKTLFARFDDLRSLVRQGEVRR